MKIPKEELRFSILSPDHDLSGFICCEKDLEDFLKDDALTSQNNRISVTHLVFWNDVIVGFFTLTTDSIEVKGILDGDGVEDYPYSRYPALKIARLATDDHYTNRGIGMHMLREILVMTITISHNVGCRIITVDAKTRSIGFYEAFGFRRTLRKQTDSTSMYRDFHRDLIESQK